MYNQMLIKYNPISLQLDITVKSIFNTTVREKLDICIKNCDKDEILEYLKGKFFMLTMIEVEELYFKLMEC